MNTQFLP